jgi:hypothetical protein
MQADIAVPLGVVKRLRTMFGDAAGSYIDYSPNLRPPPAMGQWFITVGQHTSVKNCRERATIGVHTLTIAVTCRYAYVPQDRRGAVEGNSFLFPDALPSFGSNGYPAICERPDIQPPIVWLASECEDILLGDYEVLKDICAFLGNDKSGESHGTSLTNDPQWVPPVPFKQSSTGNIQPQDGSWVGSRGAADGDIELLMVTVAGLETVYPNRYARGDDRTWETL